MSFAIRLALCVLALSLSLNHPALAQPPASSSFISSPSPSAESAVRAVAEKYFARFAAEDLEGVMSLWSEKSPD